MSNTPCPACKLGAASRGLRFDGGWLHPSAEYAGLLHCNYCGAYYRRPDQVGGEELACLREAAERLRGWSAGAGPDGKLIR